MAVAKLFMESLRAAFEDQLVISLDDDGDAVIGETVFNPVTILRSDSEAWTAEFNAWLNDTWLPEQSNRLEDILSATGNRKRFNDLCIAIQNEQVVPLIGSGMCVPSHLPKWSEFLRSVRKHSTIAEDQLENLLNTCAFEEAIDRLLTAMPKRLFDECINHELRIDEEMTIAGSVSLLPSLFGTLVLTTNLDNILETLYIHNERRFAHVLAGTKIAEYRTLRAESESFLLKLHGDSRSQDGRVLSTNEYERAYSPDGVIRRELTLILQTKSILFLGCSLGPDRTVSMIAEIAASDSNMPKHYAFVRQPATEDASIAREHFLTERDIFPVWYKGDHDECIQALLIGIARHLGQL